MATVVNSQGRPTYSIVLGTPGFMAPEQASGRPIYASDLYSLGMTAIYLLTGKLPQDLDTDLQTEEMLWQQHAPKINPHFAAMLNQAIQYHPRDRYTTAIKMLDALQSITSTPPPRRPTQATLVVSPPKKKPVQQPTAASPQVTAVSNHPASANRQRTLIFSSLLAGSLLCAGVIFAVSRQQPKSSVFTSSPQSSSQQSVSSTPAEPESPPPVPPVKPPAPQQNQPQATQTQGTDLAAPEVKDTPTPSAAVESVPQQQQPVSSISGVKSTVPVFPPGTSESKIKAVLGNPTRASRGYFPNTRTLLYELKQQTTLGYIVDRSSGRLRQTEVSFAASADLAVMQATLQGMLGSNASTQINEGLQRVYQRRNNNYAFNTGELKGVVERNSRDRIYIGVWEADLH